ncbi:protein BIG GRAIN 1-like E [Olea europaea var. sylvestris]|uniref:protein BIG GRAIN 1-like E n=1 Tax=Olea europaea var. sylvestris TaxID=158386 RepID=UPI000C1D05F5|nr:protein BIG GRAIN 1-like E [Olea europaea var. sylvestris]
MSIAELSDHPNQLYNKPFHWRNDSGELDVFEAARYFSGGGTDEVPASGATSAQKTSVPRTAQISLEMPITRSSIPSQTYAMEKQNLKEKKNKQPSSPGGRLAHFLNSLFNQASLKKKKSKIGAKTAKDEEESPGGRRKRRSSISHFRTASSTTDSKSFYSSSSSGFRTPPPHANTPTKSYKEIRNFSDYKQIISVQKFNGNVKNDYSSSWLDEKFKFRNGYSEINWADKYPSEENEFRKISDVDDGADSDSSSDLFDLPNHELEFYSSDPPVYETTHIDSIKRAAPISSTGKV